MTDHKNDERTVRCPVEGCDATPLARGVNLHVNRSSGDGHGPRGEVPEGISFENLETVGEREVEMDYPDERNNEKHARLCPYCSQSFAGVQGLMIHLGQTAGRKNHPANPKERHEPGDFPRVEVDAQGNLQQVVDTSPTDDTEKGAVSEARVFNLIADLVADGEVLTANRVRSQLLGVNSVNRPVRTESPHPEVFDALLAHGYADDATNDISAAVEKEGIMVALRGESALYTTDEALDLAAYLEELADRRDWQDSEMRDFIEFLRYSTELLRNDGGRESLHEEFSSWR
ncbi:hypothetical protein B4589_012740 [Halolamina sp. CBA1230]|uniref:hypothetical protein n=1 Tax=Halolamina sp. CBA1230 TaxID=1853690 RepID=UPI0009A24DE1|nr:hypothetical protein [Halolamina sp. CBA1230]QKY21198.1 hypothetical protein B4589_012740 [Halolamina sp. CBA1230]